MLKPPVDPMAKRKNKNFRTEVYFVGGRMKRRKIPLIEGLEVDEFIRRNANEGFLVCEGDVSEAPVDLNRSIRRTD